MKVEVGFQVSEVKPAPEDVSGGQSEHSLESEDDSIAEQRRSSSDKPSAYTTLARPGSFLRSWISRSSSEAQDEKDVV